jgi:hypothetical protein
MTLGMGLFRDSSAWEPLPYRSSMSSTNVKALQGMINVYRKPKLAAATRDMVKGPGPCCFHHGSSSRELAGSWQWWGLLNCALLAPARAIGPALSTCTTCLKRQNQLENQLAGKT